MRPPEYHTNRFALKPYRLEDEDAFVETALDAESVQFMGGATGDEATERALFHKVRKIYEQQEKRWFWVWGIYQQDKLCAHLELKETEHTTADELEIVYMVHPSARRQGLMLEVISFLQRQQNSWGRNIIATVDRENQASLRLLEKCGIKRKVLIKEQDSEFYKINLIIPS